MYDLIFSLSFVALLKEHLIYNVSIFKLMGNIYTCFKMCIFLYS